MALKDVIGHQAAIARIRSALFGDRPGHAYVFVGPEGVGKYLAAVGVANMLLCTAPTDSGRDACGQCKACRQIEHDNHPDLHVVEAREDKRFITLEQIHDLREQYSLRPHGDMRIAVLRDADRMTTEAANSLLKTLEEPPPWGMLILTASRPTGMPETILSRCQALRFGPLSRDDAVRVLREKLGWELSAAQFAAAFADGSIGQAIELQEIGGAELGDFFVDRLQRLTRQDNFELAGETLDRTVDLGKTLEAQRNGLRLILRVILRYYRDVLGVRLGLSEARVFNVSRIDAIRDLAERIPQPVLEDAIEATLDAWEKINRNANLRLLLENYFFVLGDLTQRAAG